MSLPIITADQRLAEPRGIKGCIFGKSGIGKTSLLWTLDPAGTLFMDLEAGDLAIEGWPGDSIRPRTWAECRDFAVFIGGPNPALRDEQPYSPAHYKAVCDRFGDPAALGRYDTIFVDSITVAGRLCFQWCKGQPEAVSEKTGKPDVRGAYGLHGREMIAWLTHLQHTRGRNVWFVGILDEKFDDFNRRIFQPQIDGSKTRSHYLWKHEPCFMGWRRPNRPPKVAEQTLPSTWELPSFAKDDRPDHPTPKPLDAFGIPMRQHVARGGLCYEPFSGSGSQIMAGEANGRRVFAMEISPAYVDVAVDRWQAETGRDAILEGDGRTFAQVRTERLGDDADARADAPAKDAAPEPARKRKTAA